MSRSRNELSAHISISTQKFSGRIRYHREGLRVYHLPTINISGACEPMIIIQGGMGSGIGNARLAGAVALRGGCGTVSGVALDRYVTFRTGQKSSHRESATLEIQEAIKISGGKGAIAINCLAAIETTYKDTIQGAVEGGVNAVFVGAGLPLDLPEIVPSRNVALVPIVSSAKALRIICRRWQRYDRMPDAVILEGPLAGGHLGFKAEDIAKEEMKLENLFPSVKETAIKNGDFPVIVAGGIWDRGDILRWAKAGASGVQMGTRFLATHESGASVEFKEALINAQAADIEVAVNPGSPSGMPFRVLSTSPGYQQALRRERPFKCDKGYMLYKGKCRANETHDSFCICNALLSATGHNTNPNEGAIFTVGTNAFRVTKIQSVNELMDELVMPEVESATDFSFSEHEKQPPCLMAKSC